MEDFLRELKQQQTSLISKQTEEEKFENDLKDFEIIEEELTFEDSPLANYLKDLKLKNLSTSSNDFELLEEFSKTEENLTQDSISQKEEKEDFQENNNSLSRSNLNNFLEELEFTPEPILPLETKPISNQIENQNIKQFDETEESNETEKFLTIELKLDEISGGNSILKIYVYILLSSFILHPDESPFYSLSESLFQILDSSFQKNPFRAMESILQTYKNKKLHFSLPYLEITFIFILLFILSFLYLIGIKISIFWIFLLILFMGLYSLYYFKKWQTYQREQLIRSNLKSLNKFIELSKSYYQILQKSIRNIQEIELISLGYKITNPLSPISRMENNIKSKKSSLLRKQCHDSSKELIKTFQTASKFLIQQFNLIENTLNTPILIEENNETAEITINGLKEISFQYFFFRSRIGTSLLYLFQKHSLSIPNFYFILNSVNLSLKNNIQQLENILNIKFLISPNGIPNERTKTCSFPKFINTNNQLKILIESLLTRLQLCEQTLINQESKTELEQIIELVENCNLIKKDFQSALDICESGIEYLNFQFNKLNNSSPQNIEEKEKVKISSSEGNNEVEEKEDKDVVTIEKSNWDILDVAAQSFEAYTGELLDENSNREKRKLSRQERILLNKKREQEKEENQKLKQREDEQPRLVIQELKDILLLREKKS